MKIHNNNRINGIKPIEISLVVKIIYLETGFHSIIQQQTFLCSQSKLWLKYTVMFASVCS